jgi:hypothetical protein
MMILETLPKTLTGSNSECQRTSFENRKAIAFELAENQKRNLCRVKDTSSEFLKYSRQTGNRFGF